MTVWDRAKVPALAHALLDKIEQVKLQAYRDSAGYWTIGCGSRTMPSGRPVQPGDRISQADADALRDRQARAWVAVVVGAVHVPLPVEWAAVLISFTHNCGPGALPGSTLAGMLNAGQATLAAGQLGGWVLAGGAISLGLMRRRELERRIALGADLSAFDAVWRLTEADLMPGYRRAFADAAAFHHGAVVSPGARGTLHITAPTIPVDDSAATEALNAAQVAHG